MIKDVFYELLDEKEYPIYDMAEYFYYKNLMNESEECLNDYLNYEETEMMRRKEISGEFMIDNDINYDSKTLFALSGLDDGTIIVIEL